MKCKNITILSILAILCLFNPVYAENKEEIDIYKWSFVEVTKKSDQDEKVVVSKYYGKDNNGEIAFCIEPNQDFNPIHSVYYKKHNDNENIYKLGKAYEQFKNIDDQNNYYIATQLLIWQEINGIEYTFSGNDYKEYKQEILNIINPRPLLKAASVPTFTNESYVNQEVTIYENYSDYNAQGEGVEIIENNENGFVYKITSEEPELKTIKFSPKTQDQDNSFNYVSDDSQDLYHFEGEYSNLKNFSLNLKTLKMPKNISINYSKKDESDNPIDGAEFSLYKIDNENYDEELIFIQNEVNLNLYDVILNDYTSYDNLSIKTSERYEKYISDGFIKTSEIGYFPYKIYNDDELIKQGIVYVTNDINITNGTYSKIGVKRIFKGYSEDLEVNTINNIPNDSSYYLCESEPSKGYTYKSEPCTIVDASAYSGDVYEFINSQRTYTLRLMKESPEEILLDGAKFKITYFDGEENKDIIFTTGYLNIEQEDDNKYLIYKFENDESPKVVEFEDDVYMANVNKSGKYYYYESNSEIVDESLLNGDYVYVVEGGFVIENMPYSSSITVEELQAPKGFVITEPIYHISPDISYSEITFKNYRVNYLDIIPAKRFKVPKTCIDE